MAGVEGFPGLRRVNGSPAEKGRHRAPPANGRQARAHQAATAQPPAEIFTRFVLDYAAQHPGQTISVLQAGCTTAGADLDLAALRASPYDVAVAMMDDDVPAAQAAVAYRPELGSAALGELRSMPMPPRSFDVVHCSMLLDRITNSEVVLGRLVAALKPGGLLLLRTTDRETAAGFLDRKLPESVRVMLWRSSHPGQPGPYPAIYEPLASASGLQAFFTRHGLAVAHRQVCTADDQPPTLLAARRVVAWLSRGRLDPGYDELRYVARKPVDRFARVL
jgi:SAM-dependent methyltransferase